MNNPSVLLRHSSSEPLLRIARRDALPLWRSWSIRVVSVVCALIVNAIFIYFVTDLNPVQVYSVMFKGSFKSVYKFICTLRDTTFLLGIGIALAPAFKMRFWNIGAEGQVLMGGLATAIVMIYCADFPTWLLFLTMIIASVAAGALWGLIPALFKAKWNTNETLFTLMMNYVAINLVLCFTNLWRGSKSSMGTINVATKAGWFPELFGYRFSLNIIIILVFTVLMFIYLKYSKHGYEIAVVGESQNTAKYAGINVKKVIIRTMIISGAICGICGFITVAGRDQTISTATSGGYGFTAIIVAWLAKFNTFYMALISFVLIFLENGAAQIASAYSTLNDYAASIITGIILFFILGSEFFINYRLIFRAKTTKEAK